MKPFSEHGAAAAERPVQRAREAGAEGHHPAPERHGVRRLDEKVRVRGLQAVVNEAELATVADDGEAALECADESHGAQRG